MIVCNACKCGRLVAAEKSLFYKEGWLVICHHCELRTKVYKSEASAVKAWNAGIYAPTSLMVQDRLRKTYGRAEDLDTDGCADLIGAIYERAIKDYEAALDIPNVPEKYKTYADAVHNGFKGTRNDWAKEYTPGFHGETTRKEVEDMFWYGDYMDHVPKEAGIRRLQKIIRERKEAREKQAMALTKAVKESPSEKAESPMPMAKKRRKKKKEAKTLTA